MSALGRRPSGYKLPPAEHQFQKGQSGNPRGRPRKTAPVPEGGTPGLTAQELLARQIAKRPVTIRDGDKSDTVPVLEAVLRAEAAQAARGKRLDKKDMLERQERIEAKIQAAKREDYDDWAMIKAFKIEERKTVATERWKMPLPHPDDIILGPDFAVDIIGPLNAAELANVDASCRYRDLLILQSVLDCHARVKSKTLRDRKDLLPVSMVLAIWIDRQLFRRFRLGHGGLAQAMDKHLWKSRRDLEDEIRATRQAMGVDIGGKVSPMLHAT